MAIHITGYRKGFPKGYTRLTQIGETENDTGMEFGLRVLGEGESCEEKQPDTETLVVLLNGNGQFQTGELVKSVHRSNVFDEQAFCLHVPAGVSFRIESESKMECAIVHVKNGQSFDPRILTPNDIPEEKRGKGKVNDTAYRLVRTFFDYESVPKSSLVAGESVTLPGRWSSYPPHHHPQPEIYFYKFMPEQGYGHAELGEKVYKVYQNDLIKIFDGEDHPQTAAPGYAMYYLWVIRHFPGKPYKGFEFTPQHEWVFGDKAKVWEPEEK